MSRFDAPIEANFTYVNTVEPSNPDEGETWYNPDTDEAAVWDSNAWQQMNITNHGQLSGVSASDHHARYTDAEAATAAPVQSVEGQTGDVVLTASSPQSGRSNSYGSYTNNTGSTNLVSVITDEGQYSASSSVTVDGVQVSFQHTVQDGGLSRVTHTFVVPDGSSYSISDESGQQDTSVTQHVYQEI